MSIISASTTLTTALQYTADTDGTLVFKTGATPTTALTLNADQSATFAGTVNFSTAGFTNLSYTGTLTGGTGVVNLGSGQFYKDASGNVGIGTDSPATKLQVAGTTAFVGTGYYQVAGGAGNYGTNLSYYSGGGDIGMAVGTSSSGYVYQTVTTNHALAFGTNNTERMRIDSSGNLCVGNNASLLNARLTVRSAGTAGVNTAFYNSAYTNLGYITENGAWVTGATTASPYNNTTAAAANMYVDSAGLLYRSTSSLKYKTNVQNAIHGLAEVIKLRPVTYKGKNDGDTVFGGLIAEEVDAAGLTEFVQYADDGTPDALAYGQMVSLAFKAIQELNAKVDAQAAEIAALKGTK